jgi:hypothetical protein
MPVRHSVTLKTVLDALNGIRLADAGTGNSYSFAEFVEAGIWRSNDSAVGAKTLPHDLFEKYAPRRVAAAALLLRCIDRWIDSGVTTLYEYAHGRTCPAEAQENIRRFWIESRIVDCRPTATAPHTMTLEMMPPIDEADDLECAVWSVRFMIWIILSTDLGFKIARCRWSDCDKYFALTNRQSKLAFSRGIFCSTTCRHNDAIKKSRMQLQADRLQRAAQLVARQRHAADWFTDVHFKLELKTLLNLNQKELLKRTWITIHQVEIETKAAELRSAAPQPKRKKPPK